MSVPMSLSLETQCNQPAAAVRLGSKLLCVPVSLGRENEKVGKDAFGDFMFGLASTHTAALAPTLAGRPCSLGLCDHGEKGAIAFDEFPAAVLTPEPIPIIA